LLNAVISNIPLWFNFTSWKFLFHCTDQNCQRCYICLVLWRFYYVELFRELDGKVI